MCYDTYGKPVYNNSKATYSPKKQPKTDVRDLTAQSKVNVKEAAPAAESGGERKPMNLLKQVDSPKLTADPNAMNAQQAGAMGAEDLYHVGVGNQVRYEL